MPSPPKASTGIPADEQGSVARHRILIAGDNRALTS
jgi:hypothetical protein